MCDCYNIPFRPPVEAAAQIGKRKHTYRNPRQFYVYILGDENGNPIYIGKGQGSRIFARRKYVVSKYCIHSWHKSKILALECERRLIAEIGSQFALMNSVGGMAISGEPEVPKIKDGAMKPTQKEIAKKLGISDSQFSRVLSGDQHLDYLIAKHFITVILKGQSEDATIWIKGGGTSAQRREAWWDYLLTLEKKEV